MTEGIMSWTNKEPQFKPDRVFQIDDNNWIDVYIAQSIEQLEWLLDRSPLGCMIRLSAPTGNNLVQFSISKAEVRRQLKNMVFAGVEVSLFCGRMYINEGQP